MPSVAALGLYALIIANCYSPTSLRFEWRALDTPFYLGALLLLPALAFVTAARVTVC
jgi:hypothetical protein